MDAVLEADLETNPGKVAWTCASPQSGRKIVAHGASRGKIGPTPRKPRKGRKKSRPELVSAVTARLPAFAKACGPSPRPMDDREDLNLILGMAIDNDKGGMGDAEFTGRGDTAKVSGGGIAAQHFYCLEDACHES